MRFRRAAYVTPVAALYAGASALTYVQSANLAYLWDPETIVATDGQSLSSWTDSISSLSTAGTPSGQPTYKASSLNSKPGVRFAGSQYFDLGRPAGLMSTISGDFTIMIVCTNLVAGASASFAQPFGCGDGGGGGLYFVLNTTNIGRSTGEFMPNPLAANDLYVIFYSGRRSGFTRVFGGVNGTSFFPKSTVPTNGTLNWGIGTGQHDTVANGNTASFRGDILKICVWNTNLSFTDCVRQARRFHTYFGKPMPWAGVNKFVLDEGDSITEGFQGKVNANYTYFSAINLGRKFGEWSNNGRTNATMTQLADDFVFQYTGLSGADALGIPVVLTWMEYANMRATSGTAVYTQTDRYAAQVKTVDPTMTSVFMTSTALGGAVAGQGDQTALGGLGTNASAQGTYRIAYSESYRITPHVSMDLVVSLHQDAAIGQIGANPYSGSWPTTDFGDTNHPLGTVGMSAANGYARIGALHSAAIAPLL